MRMVDFYNIIQKKEAITMELITKYRQEREEYIIMRSMEQKRKNRLEYIKKRLSLQFKSEEINSNECFLKDDGVYFHVFEFPGSNALAIEYADDLEEAKINRFEDGDRFYLDEMNEDEMFSAMLKEIED